MFGNCAHVCHCFPAVFLLLCFGSCLIVFGGCLGDTRSEFSPQTEMDGRGGQKIQVENVKETKKGTAFARLLVGGGVLVVTLLFSQGGRRFLMF